MAKSDAAAPATGRPFWEELTEFRGAVHRADRDHPGYVPGLLLVFVHGVLSTHDSTWIGHSGGGLPADLLSRLGADADVLAFRYPARWAEWASVRQAARDLATILSNDPFKSHRHVVFVAHSNGGVVVKRYLSDQFALSVQELDRVLDPPARFNSDVAMDTPWGRTRGVINFDVPHFGGAYYLTVVGTAVSLLMWPWAAGWQKVREVRQSRFGWEWRGQVLGHNSIFWNLFPLNPARYWLHRRHLRQLAEMGRRWYPYPAIRDVLADRPGVIRPPGRLTGERDGDRDVEKDSDGRYYFRLPGDHTTVKLDRWYTTALPTGYAPGEALALLAGTATPEGGRGGWLGGLRDWRSVAVAEGTLRKVLTTRLSALSRVGRIDRLIGSDDPSDGKHSQASLLRDVRDQVRDGSRRVHVTGAGGVGKSTVVRMFVRQTAVEYLANLFTTGHRLPVYFQLYRWKLGRVEAVIRAAPENRGRELWAALVHDWCEQANKEPGTAGRFSPDWLEARLADPSRPTVVVVDSIDDFLTLHPLLTLGDFREAFRELDRWAVENPRVSVVAVTRTTLDDPPKPPARLAPENLLGRDQTQPELAMMTIDDCRAMFPAVARVLDDPARPVLPEVRELLLKPLFAALFEGTTPDTPAGARKLADQLHDRGSTFGTAVKELLQQSGLLDAELGREAGVDTQDVGAWLAALAVVNQQMFNRLGPSVSEAQIEDAAAAVAAEWDVGGTAATPVAQGARLLRRPELRRLLLDRTILRRVYATVARAAGDRDSSGEYAVYHREFEDFLSAWHLAECVRHGRFRHIEKRGHTVPIFTLAGELADRSGLTVGGPLVRQLAADARKDNVWVGVGNLGALIGNSRIALVDQAAQALVAAMWWPVGKATPPWAAPTPAARLAWQDFATIRFIMLSSWCRRGLKPAGTDPDGPTLRAALTRPVRPDDISLWDFWERPGDNHVDPMTRALVWAYLTEYARTDAAVRTRLGDARPPDPTTADAAELLYPSAALAAAAAAAEAAPADAAAREVVQRYRLRFLSYQIGLLSTARSIRRHGSEVTNPDRLTNVVLYALPLAAVVARGQVLDPAVRDPNVGIHGVVDEEGPAAELVLAPGHADLLRWLNLSRALLGMPALTPPDAGHE